ncbi:MAG: hypothetical protein ACYC5A_08705 [Thermoleophilia bacterium]
MRFRHLSVLLIAALIVSLTIVACGDEDVATTGTAAEETSTDIVTAPEGAAWVGVWNIVTENGLPPAENGYNSLILTLTADAFTSEYDSDAAACTWSGSHTATPATLSLTTDAASGPPCDEAVGKTRTAQLTLSADGNTLTLDWTAEAMGTLQVYQRDS